MNYLKAIVVVLLATNSILSFGINSLCISDSVPVAPKDSVYWKRFGNIYNRDTMYGAADSLPKRYVVQNLFNGGIEKKGLCYQLPDSSYLWNIDSSIQNYATWKEITYFFPELNNLELSLNYTDSSFVRAISLCKLKDQLDGTHSELYFHLNFNKGTSFKDCGGQVFTIMDLGYIEIYFHPNNRIKSFGFYPFTQDYQSYLMEFRPDLTIRSYGFLQGNCPVGTWLYYDENGLVEKITENALVDRQHIEKVVFEKGKSSLIEVPK